MLDLDVLVSLRASAVRHALLCTPLVLGACVDSADLGDVPRETDAAGGTDGDVQTSTGAEETDPAPTDGLETQGSQTDGQDTDPADTDEGPEASEGSCEVVPAQPGEPHAWTLICGSPSAERVELLATTASGDVLVGVETRLGEDLEPTVWDVGDEQYTHSGSRNVLLLRVTPTGQIVWSRHFSSEGNNSVSLQNIAVCADGFVIAGETGDTPIDYGDGRLDGGEFIARFGSDGTLLWDRYFEVMQPAGHISVIDMQCDTAGNLAIAGRVRDGADFGAGMTPAGIYDSFVAKYDVNGALLFGNPLLADRGNEGSIHATASSVALHEDGSTYAFLSHNAAVDFGGGPILPALSGFGDQAVLVRLDEGGELEWSAQVGGEGLVYSKDLQIDDEGRALVSGIFLNSIQLGDDVHENVFPYDEQERDIVGTNYDAYLAAFDSDGTYAWGEALGWMRNEDAWIGRFSGGEALVYRVSERLLSLATYAADGSTELVGAELDAPNSGYQYRAMRATDSSVVLGGEIDAAMNWPTDLSDYVHGDRDAVVVYFGL